MGAVSFIWLFFVATLQPQRARLGFCQSFPVLHTCHPATHSRLIIFLTRARKSFFAWFHKNETPTPQSICRTSFPAKLQGSATASSVERPPQARQSSAHDAQPSCSTCGLPATASCPHCEDKFCHSHIYQCRECQISFCGNCLDLHSLEGHWSDSDTARAMAASTHPRSLPSQPMCKQSFTPHPQRDFATNKFTTNIFTTNRLTSTNSLLPAQSNSQSCSWRSTIKALLRRPHTRNYLARSVRSLFAIFALFSPEVAQ